MSFDFRLSPEIAEGMRCPVCRARLGRDGEALRCENGRCAARFPVVDGVPVLINEQTSVFTIERCIARLKESRRTKPGAVGRLARRFGPRISRNVRAQENYARLRDLLIAGAPRSRVLVVGGGDELGQHMEAIAEDPRIELVSTDVFFGPLTKLVCDAHDIPFKDSFFDGVVIQAVLEHVCDPWRSVEEIHRVLKPNALVYAETPFMQQVHLGRYDFTRFTHLGHRRLFRRFEEIDSGAVGGPGMALAWSYRYFLLSFPESRPVRGALKLFSALTSFPLKYFDHLLIRKPGTIDAAAGFYFLGRRSDEILSDKELIKLYRGAI